MINLKPFVTTLLIILFFGHNLWAGSKNIAPKAKVTVSTILGENYPGINVTDGIIGVANKGEWACEPAGMFWGYIRFPWVQLDWDSAQTINKIILYDRPGLDMHSAGGRLMFDDGSRISVNMLPNNGGPKVVTFDPKVVKWVRFEVMDGVGQKLGLSEIEVFPAHDSYDDLISWVDPFVETTRGRYFYFTPGCRPFGMAAAAPITRNKNQFGGGYNYNSPEILGFGQLHGWMISGIQIMPVTGKIDPTKGEQGWKSSFSHDDELAQPGYQRVFLKDYDTWVELTSTTRSSIYRFSFNKKNKASILTNVGGYLGNSTMHGAKVRKVSNTKIEGTFLSAGRLWGGPKDIEVFFAIEFSKPFSSLDGWDDGVNRKDIVEQTGSMKMTRMDSMDFGVVVQSYWSAPSAGVLANYEVNDGDQILMRIGISYTSTENAWNNLRTESTHWNFDQYRADSEKEWNEILANIEVKGGTKEQKVKFYTDLWHALLGRRRINDVNGDYPDYTEGELDWKFTDAKLKVRTLPKDKNGKAKYNMYNSDALWLTKWNLNVLWGIAWPEVMDDFSASMVQYAKNGGLLPRGPNIGGYSYIMTGNPATSLLVSTYQKGLMKKIAPKEAFDAMKRNHMPGGMMGDSPEELQFYIDNGYCPGNAGKSLEWSFQDWSLGQMALKMGEKKDFNYFNDRSKTWKILFREGEDLIYPKAEDGSWLHDEPLSMSGWVESNSWQGSWQISHDIPGLAAMMGGNDELSDKLNYAFEQSAKDDFVFGYGNGYVSYANQPGCSNAHVFNYAGKPWLTQYWVRRVNEQAYGAATPESGYGGHDEDQGQMGGVSALMSLGIFSLKGTNDTKPFYEITSPVFDEITIKLDKRYYEGESFKIIAKNNSKENVYIQSMKLNGETLDRIWFYHDDFQKGGTLEMVLGSEPNKQLGADPKNAPPSTN